VAWEIYKRGQGTWARLTTAVGLGLFCLFGLSDVFAAMESWERVAFGGVQWRMIVTAVLAAAAAFLIAWLVNGRRSVDFLIVTEAELRKVSWPTRRELKRQTIVVVVFTLLLGGIIFGADLVFLVLSRLLFMS